VESFWIHHPGAKAKLVRIDLQWLWQPSVVKNADSPGAGGWLDTLRSVVEPAYMIVVYVLAAIGIFLVPRRLAALVLLLLGYQTVVAIAFVGVTRYRVPWDFLLDLVAAVALVSIAARIRNRSQTT
jgi:hypothetical protein